RENERFGMLILSGKLPRQALLGSLLLGSTLGCSHGFYGYEEGLAQRILPPLNIDAHEGLSAPSKTAQEAANGKGATPEPELDHKVDSAPGGLPAPPQANEVCQPGQTLTLPDVVALAFRLQPRLRASLESIQQARGREDIAFAAFLPALTSAYSVGGFDLNVGGAGVPLPGLPRLPAFTFPPFPGSLPRRLEPPTR